MREIVYSSLLTEKIDYDIPYEVGSLLATAKCSECEREITYSKPSFEKFKKDIGDDAFFVFMCKPCVIATAKERGPMITKEVQICSEEVLSAARRSKLNRN